MSLVPSTIPLTVANFETSLAAPLSKTGTSLVLTSILTGDNTNVAAGTYCLTVDQGQSNIEHIIATFDGSTTTGTILTRGVSVVDGNTAISTTTTPSKHRVYASVKFTDHASLIRIIRALNGTDTLGAKLTYATHPTVSADTDIPDKLYVDNAVAAPNGLTAFLVTKNGSNPTLTVNIGAGEFISGSTPTAFAGASAQAVTDNATNYVQLSLAGAVVINTSSFVDGDIPLATVTTSGGTITAVSDKRAWLTMALTPNQIAALAGSSGTPSSSNKFVTAADVSATPAASTIVRSDAASSLSNWIPNLQTSTITTGEAIDGTATVPLCVCVKASDGLVYKAKANDTTLINAFGFINTKALITTTPSIIYSGIVSGFTGLTKGAAYYVTDTAGTISTTPSTTCQIPIGKALSATQLEIIVGKKTASATSSTGSINGTTNTAITCGFNPAKIEWSYKISSPADTHQTFSVGIGTFVNGSVNFKTGIQINYSYIIASPASTFVDFATLGGSSSTTSSSSFSNSRTTTISLISFDTSGFTWNATPTANGGSAVIDYIVSE